jgi:thioesterase domain-containing protein
MGRGFEHQTHSILAMKLIVLVNKEFGKNFPVSDFLQSGTIEHLAKVLRHEHTNISLPLISIQPFGSKQPFFCVHPIEGSVLCYLELAQYFGLDYPFYGLQAAKYIKALRDIQTEGPYLLGGWSMGGTIAFEMARQLEKQNQQVSLLALIDTQLFHSDADIINQDSDSLASLFAQELENRSGEKIMVSDDIYSLSLNDQLLHILNRSKDLGILPLDVTLPQIQDIIKVFKSNKQALYSYIPQTYSGRVTLFLAEEASTTPHNIQAMDWSKLTQGVDLHILPGNHYSMIKHPNVEELAKKLRSCIPTL